MASIRCLLIIFLILISQNILGCDFHDFDAYQLKLTTKEVERKIKTYLEKDETIQRFYRLTSQFLYIGDLEHQQLDYILKLKTSSSILTHPCLGLLSPLSSLQTSESQNSCKIPFLNEFSKAFILAGITHTQLYKHKKSPDLKNIRIAIDPGHFGGSWAELEERYVAIPAEMTKNKQPIRFHEGDLTYSTALELKRLLENEGAVVLLTRSGIGRGAIKEDFFEWIRTHADSIQKSSPLPQVFRNYYNREDLKERAKIINAFSPDLTIVIHFNSHLTEEEKKQKSLLTRSNYNLAFIPGAFCKGELNTVRDRYEFLRLIVTHQVEESLKLSESVTKQFVKYLDVPLISENEKISYIDRVCLFQKQGIYSRNLVLTRLIHSPICYGETLIQNNQEEIYRLSESSTSIENIPCPQRVQAVALAYFEGIKDYFKDRSSIDR